MPPQLNGQGHLLPLLLEFLAAEINPLPTKAE